MGTLNSNRLTLYIVIGIVAAVFVALVFPRFGVAVGFGGEIFLRLLKMLVVPLVMTSVACGILGMGDIRKLGRPGGYTIMYYLTTTVLAVVLGLVVVNLIQPGAGFDQGVVEAGGHVGPGGAGCLVLRIGRGGQIRVRHRFFHGAAGQGPQEQHREQRRRDCADQGFVHKLWFPFS